MKKKSKLLEIGNWKLKIPAKQVGFTLIELLVVIAIIGILSALLMTNFVGIRQRARDGQRKADLRQIQSALELYRSDVGSYPTETDLVTGSILRCGTGESMVSGSSIYMKTIPCDGLNTSEYQYQYTGTSVNYCLRSCLENTNDSQKDVDNNSVPGCTFDVACENGVSYTLQNP